jgi:hypothetical protein
MEKIGRTNADLSVSRIQIGQKSSGMVGLLGCCGWQVLQARQRNGICVQNSHIL